MTLKPLRYKISNWCQAKDCLSNNSNNLHIVVSDYLQNTSLSGTKVEIVHNKLGTLFAYIVDASGELVSDVGPMLTTTQVLKELARYGFLIEYDQKRYIDPKQLEFLKTLRALSFDKLRLLNVVNPRTRQTTTCIVVFKIKYLPSWLDNTVSVYQKAFDVAVSDGYAFNVSTVSEAENYRWDWLDYVANIDDIIREYE